MINKQKLYIAMANICITSNELQKKSKLPRGTFLNVKNNPNDKIFWKDNSDKIGEWVFSFDKKKEFNMFRDYPHELTSEQKKIFDEENPYWANFFKDRQ